MKKITLLTEPNDCPLSSEHIGILFENASDSVLGGKYEYALPAIQLIGDLELTMELSCSLTNKILDGEPCFRGVPQLSIFQEVISDELQRIFHVIHLHDFIVNEGYSICEFVSASWWSEKLSKLVSINGSALIVIAPEFKKRSKMANCITRIISGVYKPSIIWEELKKVANYIDRFHYCDSILNRFKVNKIDKNKCWFYSTAINYTNIGLFYEPYFPENFNFLIENKLTGGRPLIEINRKFYRLYNFSKKSFIPSFSEIKNASAAIKKHIYSKRLDSKCILAREILVASPIMEDFYNRLLSMGLFFSSIFDYWLDISEPSMLIVGNNSYEAYALHLARRKKIPTVLLQHGVLANYYPYVDHPVDAYVVKGEFFYRRLSKNSQKRALIFSGISHKSTLNNADKKNNLIFVTSPSNSYWPLIKVDLKSILHFMICSSDKVMLPLVIRVHPLERVIDYQNLVNKIVSENNLTNVKVYFSQFSDFKPIINNSAAMILFDSTMFLDALNHNVPAISFKWFNSPFRDQLVNYNAMFCAENFNDLDRLINLASQGKLPVNSDARDFFNSELSVDNFKLTLSKFSNGYDMK